MHGTQGKLKLNLGSGKSTPYSQEYLNVDIADTFADGKVFKPDLLEDMRNLEFPSETFTEVRAFDCLDHIEYTDCLKLINKIWGWLKPNGILTIHLPNLRSLAGILAVKDVHHALVWMYGTDGEENFYPTNRIRWCYSKEQMVHILENNRFIMLEIGNDCDNYAFFMVAVKR